MQDINDFGPSSWFFGVPEDFATIISDWIEANPGIVAEKKKEWAETTVEEEVWNEDHPWEPFFC